jgi:catechol 2,3-dioxygenase-like lactoylglutathione lyase family enzyme
MKLEVVVVPVADVDRAKDFYKALGWREDADYAAGEDFRVVQVTPPGSACSVIFGTGVTSAAPGSAQGLQLTVADIDAARAELAANGAEMSEVFHDAGGVFHHARTEARSRARPRTTRATARSPRSATRTGTAGCCRRSRPACRAGDRP